MSDRSASDLRWDGPGQGRVLTLNGDVVQLEVSSPGAPGARKDATLPSGASVRVKVHRVKKLEGDLGAAGWFFLEGRLIDASRAVREELSRLAIPPSQTATPSVPDDE